MQGGLLLCKLVFYQFVPMKFGWRWEQAQLQECFLAADSTPSYIGEPHTRADMLKCLYQGIQIEFIFMLYLYQLC